MHVHLGGMQALEWGLIGADFVKSVIAIGCGGMHTAWQIGEPKLFSTVNVFIFIFLFFIYFRAINLCIRDKYEYFYQLFPI